MTSFSDHSASSPTGSGPAGERDQDLLALDLIDEFPLPNRQVQARNRRTGRQMMLPEEVANALSYCTGFATLDEHVQALMDGAPPDPGRRQAMRSVLGSVRDGGLFLSARELCERLKPVGTAPGPIGRPVVCIITWERPEALRRLLSSMLENCDLDGLERCFVVDDSRTVAAQAENRTIAREADQRAPVRIRYFGAQEAAEFVDSLVAELPERESAIRFLLGRERWRNYWTAGISRNVCQLLSVGRPLIVCDDDSLCDVYPAPWDNGGAEFTQNPRDAVFFESRDEWPQPAGQGRRDPFARHMQVLGLTIPEALSALGHDSIGQQAFRSATASFASRLGPHSRVLTSECAALGDPGTGGNQWLATLPRFSVGRLLERPEMLDVALRRRNCWLGRVRPAFVSNSNISQITASDNRDFLPPYFPIMRGQDRIFGETCQFLFPHSVVLDLPWAAPHLPIDRRGWTDRDNDFTRPATFPGDLTSPPSDLENSCPAGEPRARIRHLALYYRELAEAPDHVLHRAWVEDWQHSWSVILALLQEQMDTFPKAHEGWMHYLQSAYRQTRGSRLRVNSLAEAGSKDLDLSGAELAAFWRQAWREYGSALEAWDEIRGAARRLIPG